MNRTSENRSKSKFIVSIAVLVVLSSLVLAFVLRKRRPDLQVNAPDQKSTSSKTAEDAKLAQEMLPTKENFEKQLASSQRNIRRINQLKKRDTEFELPNKPLSKGMNANIDSAIEAIETGDYPERLSPLIKPADFDPDAFKRDPKAYLDVIEPGRAWQSKPPGPDVKSIGTNKEFHQVKEKEAVRLEVLAEPNFPVSFTSTDLGAFENDLATITVVANESGWAQASFTATAGTVGPVNVSASSPMTSGRVHFHIQVSETQ